MRLDSWPVIGVPFASGDLLAMRRFPASSVGPGYTSLWHRSPSGRWTFYQDQEPLVACPRAFGPEIDEAVVTDIALEWTAADEFVIEFADPVRLRWTVRLAATPVTRMLSAVVSVIPNLARFGTLVHPSIESQVASEVFEDRRQFLEANDGAIFGPQFVPTTLLQYVRPDAFDVRSQFPWIDYPRAGPHVVGDVTFDDLEWTSSVPVTMPALVVLAVPGAAWMIRGRARRGGHAWLGPLWVGSLAGGLGAVTIGYVAHRYLADLVPIVLLPALVGAHLIADRTPARPSGRRRAGLAALGLLVAFGYWANVGLAIEHQHERGKVVLEERRAQLVLWRTSLPGPQAPVVRVERDYPFLPPGSGDGTLAVAGECDGLYVRVGDDWRGVSRGPGAGVFDLRVDVDALDGVPVGHRAPLLALGSGDDASPVTITRLRNGLVRVDVSGPRVRHWAAGRPAELAGDDVLDEDVSEGELKMASQLVESLTEPFEPERFEDTHRNQVLDLIDRKAAGEDVVAAPEPVAEDKVVDLMAALEASVRDAKAARGRHPTAKAASDGEDAEEAEAESRGARSPSRTAQKATKSTKAAQAAKKAFDAGDFPQHARAEVLDKAAHLVAERPAAGDRRDDAAGPARRVRRAAVQRRGRRAGEGERGGGGAHVVPGAGTPVLVARRPAPPGPASARSADARGRNESRDVGGARRPRKPGDGP